MTPLFQQLKTLCFLCLQAYQRGDLATSLHYSDMTLMFLSFTTIIMLDIRTKIFQRQSRMQDALANATAMIHHFPTNPRGYIHAVGILMKQERMMEAIQTCNTGLTYCRVNTEFEQNAHDQLEEMKASAIERRNHRTDLLQQLPYEITTLILNQLEFHEVLTCLCVSLTWREYIAMDQEIITVLLKKVVSTLKRLYLGGNSDTTSLPSFCDILDICPNLQILTYNDVGNSEIFRHDNPHQHQHQHRRPSVYHSCLTHLRLHSLQQIRNQDVEYILRRASNLEEMILGNCHQNFVQNILDTIHRFGNHMRHIKLSPDLALPKSSMNTDVGEFISINPSKKYRFDFTLDVHEYANVAADTLLPIIVNRRKNIAGINDEPPDGQENSISATPSSALAITAVNLQDTQLPRDAIEKSWQRLCICESSHLRCLKFIFTPQNNIISFQRLMESMFISMIRKCQLLEETHIIEKSYSPSRNIYEALMEHAPSIRTLGISDYYHANNFSRNNHHHLGAGHRQHFSSSIPANDQHPAMLPFFKHHLFLLNNSKLEHVSIRFITGLHRSVLFMLANLSKLKSLHLAGQDLMRPSRRRGRIINNQHFQHFQHYHPPDAQVEENDDDNMLSGSEFIKNLTTRSWVSTTASVLEHITLQDVYDMTDDSIQKLDFKKITFVQLNQITTNGIINICKSSIKLRYLEIVDCPLVDTGCPFLQDLMASKNIHFC
ncbi:hypothetical protein BDA99DRAFT_566460 [Phascolomyces articulosus]|uniref:F-box domain-containing protein n=1 Tax=Phascolomyces articulosus TaxID=60185 RepID=A0AAD5JKP7_9FUNG|nr:hypothetical protein BDA99DRAFT_566460 [Phascolomyces articulosus]